MDRFPDLGGGSSSSGASNSKAASFLQLPLPEPAGENLALHQLRAAGPSSSTQRGGHHQKDGAVARGEEISPADADAIKTEIVSHPLYSPLLASYLDCQKVGAPPDVVDRLSAVAAKLQEDARRSPAQGGRRQHEPPRADPELDQFMEAYCDMLVRYREELARPIHEATQFFKSVETQLDSITDSNGDGAVSSEDDQDTSCPGEIDPCAEDKELKHQLLRKYGGYMGSLRQEFCKRRKKGKLPKEARQMLLQWWELHNKWPYPSEAEKMALAEATRLDQKQINNWFINQRKRHWKPASEDMPPFSAMAAEGGFQLHAPQGAAAALYIGRPPFMADGMYRLGS